MIQYAREGKWCDNYEQTLRNGKIRCGVATGFFTILRTVDEDKEFFRYVSAPVDKPDDGIDVVSIHWLVKVGKKRFGWLYVISNEEYKKRFENANL